MELRHPCYFEAVADTVNLSKAAEKLFIAQAPLAVQMRQLEEQLGVALFTRHHEGVVRTAAGHKLLPQARDLRGRARRMTDLEHDTEGASGG